MLAAAGCHSAGQVVSSCASCPATEWPSGSPGELARHFYSLACDAQEQGDPCSPGYFYQAAISSWPYLSCGDGAGLPPADAWQIYQASVAGLIAEGQRLGQFNRNGKLLVNLPGEVVAVPIACLGLPWEPSDIGKIVVIESHADSKLANYHSCPGIGVPVVAMREPGNSPHAAERFFTRQMPFAATAVLRPPQRAQITPTVEWNSPLSLPDHRHDGAHLKRGQSQTPRYEPVPAVLELYDSLEVRTVDVDGLSIAMARDISAPFDYQLKTTESTGVLGFLDPGVPEESQGLRFVEPYQPGKIPIVFIHGLLSDPSTWFDTANDLREEAWFNEHYQIWGFRYASGKPFVTSAMYLRNQLQQAVVTLDPQRSDSALRQMVLVGHSMGGLIAKLQIAESEDRIWHSFASVPFASLRASGELRSNLAERCFFAPLPFVRRVILIATPHGGSSFATRGVGRLGASLVQPAEEAEQLHDQLVAANPGVFSPQFERRVPTSIDLLEPEDPTLQAIRTMRVSPRVCLYSIIGTGRTMLVEGPGDGAVSVASAVHPGVVSQRFVDATHTEIQRHPDTQAEIRAILQSHLAE